MAKILVTTATGNVSSQVVAALREAGADVRAGVLDPAEAAALANQGAEVVKMDLTDAASVEAGVAGVERIFLLTPFIEDPVPMCKNVLNAAKKAGVKHIVRSSGLGANSQAPLNIAKGHGIAEDEVKASGIGWTVLQPCFYMDNFINLAGQTIMGQGKIYGSSGDGKTAYTSTADIAAVAAKVLVDPAAHAGKTYVVTGPEALTDAEAAQVISSVIGKPVDFVNLTPEQHTGALEQAHLPGWMVADIIGLEGVKRAGWASQVTSTVSEVVGRPAESLKAYIQRSRARLS